MCDCCIAIWILHLYVFCDPVCDKLIHFSAWKFRESVVAFSQNEKGFLLSCTVSAVKVVAQLRFSVGKNWRNFLQIRRSQAGIAGNSASMHSTLLRTFFVHENARRDERWSLQISVYRLHLSGRKKALRPKQCSLNSKANTKLNVPLKEC